MNLIKAERQAVELIPQLGLELDGYRMPDGEFRVGIASASVAIGYSKEWLGRVLSRGGNTVKVLRSEDFSGQTIEVATQSIRGGGAKSTTISLDDFLALLLYAVSEGKAPARALTKAFVKMSLTDFFRAAFGDRELTLEEKRQSFYETYAASLTREDWLRMDREDVENLALGFWR